LSEWDVPEHRKNDEEISNFITYMKILSSVVMMILFV